MKCLECGYSSNKPEWIDDYYYDTEEEDEVPIFKCPKCGNEDEETIVEED